MTILCLTLMVHGLGDLTLMLICSHFPSAPFMVHQNCVPVGSLITPLPLYNFLLEQTCCSIVGLLQLELLLHPTTPFLQDHNILSTTLKVWAISSISNPWFSAQLIAAPSCVRQPAQVSYMSTLWPFKLARQLQRQVASLTQFNSCPLLDSQPKAWLGFLQLCTIFLSFFLTNLCDLSSVTSKCCGCLLAPHSSLQCPPHDVFFAALMKVALPCVLRVLAVLPMQQPWCKQAWLIFGLSWLDWLLLPTTPSLCLWPLDIDTSSLVHWQCLLLFHLHHPLPHPLLHSPSARCHWPIPPPLHPSPKLWQAKGMRLWTFFILLAVPIGAYWLLVVISHFPAL